jgi:hypothetical protein
MRILTSYGDSVVGERLVYVARKRSRERLIMKSGTHRGVSGTLYDAKCWVESPIQIKREPPTKSDSNQ